MENFMNFLSLDHGGFSGARNFLSGSVFLRKTPRNTNIVNMVSIYSFLTHSYFHPEPYLAPLKTSNSNKLEDTNPISSAP
jgi:hypothetical protein